MIDKAIEEIRARRREVWQRVYGGSVGRFISMTQAWQKSHPSRVVNLRKGAKAHKAA